jgi:hypothetical protein
MSFHGRDIADFRIEQRRVRNEGENARSASNIGGKARAADAGTEQRDRIIGAADKHRRALPQSGLARRFGGDRAKNLQRLPDRRQLGRIEAQKVDHRPRPAALTSGHEKTARRVA